MSFGLIFTLVIVILVAVIIVTVSVGSAKSNKIRDRLLEQKFIPYETFISTWDNSFIALNFDAKKIALGKNDALSVCDFSQIIQVDVLRNDNTVTSTNKSSLATRAVVGGILLGGVGALVGAVTAKSYASQELSKISLRVITESGSHSVMFLDLKNSQRAGLDSIRSSTSGDADKFYGLVLKAMKGMTTTQRDSTPHLAISSLIATRAAALPVSVASEIEKLWQLKESGAMSVDEYEQAKRSALSRS